MPVLRSPAQIEKIIKNDPNEKEVTKLIVKPKGKTALVPLADKREPIKPEAAEEFDDDKSKTENKEKKK